MNEHSCERKRGVYVISSTKVELVVPTDQEEGVNEHRAHSCE